MKNSIKCGVKQILIPQWLMQIIVTVISAIVMVIGATIWGFPGIWVGLTMLMTLRMFAGFLR
jgi:hypothetical protein